MVHGNSPAGPEEQRPPESETAEVRRELAKQVLSTTELLLARGFSLYGIDPDALPARVGYTMRFRTYDTYPHHITVETEKPWSGEKRPVRINEKNADSGDEFTLGRFFDEGGGMYQYGDAFVGANLDANTLTDGLSRLEMLLHSQQYDVELKLTTQHTARDDALTA